MNITLVGAGHYARDIVGPKYARNPDCRLKAVIAPRAAKETLRGSPLEGMPVVRCFEDWVADFGRPRQDDLFDFCVHAKELPAIVAQGVAAGLASAVLPKPVATDRAGLVELESLISTGGVWAAVASQWHYAALTRTLRKKVRSLQRPLKVYCNFSQGFSDYQLKKYTPLTALLPHMLQILHSTRLLDLTGPFRLRVKAVPVRLKADLRSPSTGDTFRLVTNMQATTKTRFLQIVDATGEKSVVADYLAVYEDSRLLKPTRLVSGGKETIFDEDNIEAMLTAIISGIRFGTPFLSLRDYRPVMESLLRIAAET